MASIVNYNLGDPIFLIEQDSWTPGKSVWRVALTEAGARSAFRAARRPAKVYRLETGKVVQLETDREHIPDISGETGTEMLLTDDAKYALDWPLDL